MFTRMRWLQDDARAKWVRSGEMDINSTSDFMTSDNSSSESNNRNTGRMDSMIAQSAYEGHLSILNR